MLTIVTGSTRKRKEIRKYIGERIEYKFESISLVEIQGNAKEVLNQKLKDAYSIVKGPVVVEDYSLYIDHLCGFPGPYIKSLIGDGELGEIVKNLQPLGEVTCKAVNMYGYVDKYGSSFIFSTETKGILVPPKREGPSLYGVDFCFIQEGTSQPYADLPEEEQDKISIRRKTVEKLINHIKKEKKEKTLTETLSNIEASENLTPKEMTSEEKS